MARRQRKGWPRFLAKLAARGLALGDFDNDGAVDVLIATNNGAPMLLRNITGGQNHWIGVDSWALNPTSMPSAQK